MKKKLWYILLTVALIVVLAGALSVGALADDPDPSAIPDHSNKVSGGEESVEGVTAGKYIYLYDDGHYMLDLEAYSTGTVKTKPAPADIILVLDVSGSMNEPMKTPVYTARQSQGYSWNNYANRGYYDSSDINTYYYYKHTDDKYYPVRIDYDTTGSGWGTAYHNYLYFVVGNETYYLDGSTVTTTKPSQYTGDGDTIWTGVLYTRSTVNSDQTRLEALQSAVGTFLDTVAEKNQELINDGAETEDLSRVAIVKFAMNRFYNYSVDSDGPDDDQITAAAETTGNHTYTSGQNTYNYTELVQDLTAVTSGEGGNVGSMKTTVDNLKSGGATAADFGMAIAKKVIDNHAANPDEDYDYTDETADNYRSRVVVLFTDGYPTYGNTFTGSVANRAINYSNPLKGSSYGVTVYSVAVYEGADPANTTENINGYLHGVSSNYPNATAYNSLGTGSDQGYYKVAADSEELESIFTDIASSAASKALGAETVMTDVMSSAFTLPPALLNALDPAAHTEAEIQQAIDQYIHVHVVPWDAEKKDADDQPAPGWSETTSYTIDQWKNECLNYGAEAPENIEVTVDGDKNSVNVTGYDYATHFKATTAKEDDDNENQEFNKNTAKLVVTFEIFAETSAVTGGEELTNAPGSGLSLNGEQIINFPMPVVTYYPKTYVVDYVTQETNPEESDRSTIVLDYSDILSDVEMLDDPEDDAGILQGQRIKDDEHPFTFKIYQGQYGTISFGKDAADVVKKMSVKYAPTTMNWDGYDRIFIKGPSKDDQAMNVWAMLAVIPANSVYYDDTFISTTKDITYNGITTRIEYTGIGYTGDWAYSGAEGNNTTQHAEANMGWIDVLADDPGYSNGIAHTSSTKSAKATFTFSGTGVDIYSRTNGSTGTVLVMLTGSYSYVDDQGATQTKKIAKAKAVDTKAASGDYYGVPVCTFTDLNYGTYTVTITVTNGAEDQGRMTYYLDGVRVYNPIQPLEKTDEVVQDETFGYGAENLGAVFTEVRSLLVDAGELKGGAVFIDEKTEPETETDPEAIKEAAQALDAAQEAYDTWVYNNITVPYEIPRNDAQAALMTAKDDLAKVYRDKVADPAHPTDEEQALIDAAQAIVDAAQDVLDDAQDDLDTANASAAKAAEWQKVLDASAAYDEANAGTTVNKTTADIATYTKDGPKTEVYLNKGQSVVISAADSSKTYYIALRSLNGDETSATINTKAVSSIKHTADMYYKAVPQNGVITIKNTGDGILAVTKLRTTGVDNTESGSKAVSTEALLSAYRALAEAPVTDYTGDVLTEEEATDVEEPIVEPTEPEEPVTETTLDEDDITIENADPEIEVTDPEPEPAAEPAAPSQTNKLAALLSSFFGFFRR